MTYQDKSSILKKLVFIKELIQDGESRAAFGVLSSFIENLQEDLKRFEEDLEQEFELNNSTSLANELLDEFRYIERVKAFEAAQNMEESLITQKSGEWYETENINISIESEILEKYNK